MIVLTNASDVCQQSKTSNLMLYIKLVSLRLLNMVINHKNDAEMPSSGYKEISQLLLLLLYNMLEDVFLY